MCWSETASVAMVGLGAAATVVTLRRGEAPAIPATLAFFTLMEGLQAVGYQVIDQCGTPANVAITWASYLHIALQPLFINAFAMAIAPAPVSVALKRRVYLIAAACSALILLQATPLAAFGPCVPGTVMCAQEVCTRSGTWHLAWDLPLNGLFAPIRESFGIPLEFPSYMFAAFVLPLAYGAWRFVIFTFVAGPAAALALTSDPNEMPAIWCLFSIGLLLVSLSPMVRHRVMGAAQSLG
ncbi:MAG: DUF5765 domain-containing protein [Dinoroseobacter sp.]|nr:DUF5765 domain-containing protein [Dinoroseobacter sp.]